MPEYEYRCKNCDNGFIVERSMNDSSAVKCVHCQSDSLSRVWTASILSGKTTSATAGAGKTEMCATTPTKPKNCCPCG